MTIFGNDRQWTMEDKVVRFEQMFKSERLVYQGIDEDDEVARTFFYEMFQDPSIKGLSEFGMLKPVTKKKVREFLTHITTKAALAVLVSLPPEENASATDGQKAKPTPIGFIALDSRWEKTLDIGLCIAREYQNRGYGGECINWALDWAFLWGGAHRVGIGTIAFNERAAKLYERIGFVPEGRLRSVAWNDGQWHDLLQFSMLDHDYRKLRKLE